MQIVKELATGSSIGPFVSNPLCTEVTVSPLQTVEKRHALDPTARRVVVDLSFPPKTSINAGIPKSQYLGVEVNLTYPSVDTLVQQVLEHGPGCMIFKVDLARAFRQLQ